MKRIALKYFLIISGDVKLASQKKSYDEDFLICMSLKKVTGVAKYFRYVVATFEQIFSKFSLLKVAGEIRGL